jgi:cytochrome oxidase Cu insertion factor (SCO1/SenC/PrrC family)
MTTESGRADTNGRRGLDAKGRRTLVLIVLIGLAPIVASYLAYYVLPRERQVNYGELLATRPAPPLAGTRLDGRPFALADLSGRWIMLVAAPGACDKECADALYATRQARTIQNADAERVVRVWLIVDEAAPSPEILAQHPGLEVVHVPRTAVAALPASAARIYLIDPRGNLVLAWPLSPDIKAVAKDLSRLLRASSIG